MVPRAMPVVGIQWDWAAMSGPMPLGGVSGLFNRPHGLHFGPGTWVTVFLLCSYQPAIAFRFLCSAREPFLRPGLFVVTTPGAGAVQDGQRPPRSRGAKRP